jgi:transmembrane sensor
MAYNNKDIENFFRGRLSKKEAENFMNWMESSEGEKGYEAIIEQVWQEENRETISGEEKKPKVRDIKANSISDSKPLSRTKKPVLLGMWLGIAASVLLVFIVGFIFYLAPTEENELEAPQIVETFTIEKSSPKGNKKMINLPDGSSVILNSDSKLTYTSDFINNRNVILEGEGFFDVVKDESHPFTVVTGNISTTALGTSFNIRAYDAAPVIQVSLATGKVKVENTKDKNLIEINPGEAVDFSTQRQTLHKKRIDILKVLHWKEGILHFDKVPFHQVIMELERWYGVEISLSGSKKVLDYKCTGTFKKHEYLSNVLKVLSYSLDFEYEINENQVELKFK